jgi:alanyl-tRNA synthetase
MTTQTAIRTAAQIRREFIDYFVERRGHTFVPSSPVVPHDDPTLLFTNAGMNQFKDVFLGHGARDWTRAVNTQKCIRAGGKHNDLEDVGKDTYHHTFFEMLGNWSFGDYFKAESIEWGWELLTDIWKIDKDRLYVTVFAGDEKDGLEPDEEAEAIWKGFVPAERISRWGRKDNFWEMGETGPCGPCSEIHYDSRAESERLATPGADLVNRDHPDVVEIWNLVFIQFNRSASGLSPLPARHVDTGMGLERLARVMQGKRSTYDTDLFADIFRAIEARTEAHPYRATLEDPIDIAYRVIADHIRCLTIAITDGARPSNEKRGYVLRRILRRAVRHAHQTLGASGPVLCDIVPAVVASLGDAFPEMKKDPGHVAEVIRDEEESFLRTLDRGIALFDGATSGAGAASVSAEVAFRLHDTYGFPFDLTRVMAEERGLTVDEAGFERLMEEARQRSRSGGEAEQTIDLPPDAMARLKHLNVHPTKDVDKYHGRPVTAVVKAIWNGTDFDNSAHIGRRVALILDRTNHYAESGGQIGDHGEIRRGSEDMGELPVRGSMGRTGRPDFLFRVDDTKAFGGFVLHVGHVVESEITVGDEVEVMVDRDRREPTRANHSATHLLNHALREVLGDDVQQKGSLVAPDRLRFDFSCPHAMSPEQIERVETLVNDGIARAMTVHAGDVPLEKAQTIHGVRAVFGERYPDPVRVVSIGAPIEDLVADPPNERWRAHSIEFCGGTHLSTTDEARCFAITQEQALAAGVRRIAAVTGAAAVATAAAGRDLEARVAAASGLDDEALVAEFDEISRLVDEMTLGAVTRHRVQADIEPLRDRVRKHRKSRSAASRDRVVDEARARAEGASGPVIVERIDGAEKETLLSAMDVFRARHEDAAIMLFSGDESAGSVLIAARVPQDLIGRGLKAGDWVREAAKTCGGGGGGRPDMAQAGGRNPEKIDEAMAVSRTLAESRIS